MLLGKMSHLRHPVALSMRERVMTPMPERFWQLLWEHERTYQLG